MYQMLGMYPILAKFSDKPVLINRVKTHHGTYLLK